MSRIMPSVPGGASRHVLVHTEARILRRLTGLRALAALGVFVFHLKHHEVASLPWGLSQFGAAGVGFFFVLSGFVLAWGTEPGLQWRVFYRRRFARVYPSDLAALLIAAVVPVVALARSWEAAAANMFMLQAWFLDDEIVYGMNGVSWSLSCEAFFYAVFPLSVAFIRSYPKKVSWLLVGFGLCLASASYVLSPAFAHHLPIVRITEFLLGVVAGLSYREGWRPHISRTTVTLAMVIGLGVSWIVEGPLTNAIMAAPFLLLILCAADSDVQGRRGWLSSPTMVLAGEVSFAFYLVHELVIVNLALLLPMAVPLQIACMLALAVTCAVFLHFVVERTCNRLLRDRTPSVALAPPLGHDLHPRS